MNYAPHAGQIHFQLGAILNDIRKCVMHQDLPGMQNLVRFMYTICSPKLSKTEREAYKALPRESDEEDWSLVYEWENNRMEFLLDAMAERNIYAWTEAPIQDAGELALDSV